MNRPISTRQSKGVGSNALDDPLEVLPLEVLDVERSGTLGAEPSRLAGIEFVASVVLGHERLTQRIELPCFLQVIQEEGLELRCESVQKKGAEVNRLPLEVLFFRSTEQGS